MQNKTDLFGYGLPEAVLSPDELFSIVEQALKNVAANTRVLVIIPDKTRDDNTHLLFPYAARILAECGVSKFDALVAQGTHIPMTEQEKLTKIGINHLSQIPNLGQIFNHNWSNPNELVVIGELGKKQVIELTGGLIENSITLTINRLLAPGEYDLILIFGATVPHEVAGFSGGAKYFFPGVAGAELTHATHWLSALAKVENIIGRIETPTRHLIEAAADFISAEIISFTSVVSRDDADRLQTHALFAGDFRLGLRKAAEISRYVHIKYTGRKYKRVVALLDEHYDELWVGGKASYRLGAIIEEGGELFIYAPHLHCLSVTHGEFIEKFGGYAPLEKITQLIAQSGELQANLCVAAHLTQVAYAGRLDQNGKIVPRYRITLASQIDRQTCEKVNLAYADYHEFKREFYEQDKNTLIVERAGRDLYLVEPLHS